MPKKAGNDPTPSTGCVYFEGHSDGLVAILHLVWFVGLETVLLSCYYSGRCISIAMRERRGEWLGEHESDHS